MTDPFSTDPGIYGVARDINNAGQIVGQAGADAVLVQNGQLTVLDPGQAWSIDEIGNIVGENPPVGYSRPARFINGQTEYLSPLPGESHGSARDNNDNGDIIGYSSSAPNGRSYATLWRDGQPVDLHPLNGRQSIADAINNQGQIVGTFVSSGGYGEAFIWEDGEFHALLDMVVPGSGWTGLITAVDINDHGQIVGLGSAPNGGYHAYLLTPVPEPATLSLLALGSRALLRRRRGR